MDLNALIEWTKEAQKKDSLRLVVKKDKGGEPHEGDINIAYNLLGEIRKRSQTRLEFLKKADRYEKDIQEYLQTLEIRGIICPLIKTYKKEKDSVLNSPSTVLAVDPFERAKREAKK